jgi:hypothetical protein
MSTRVAILGMVFLCVPALAFAQTDASSSLNTSFSTVGVFGCNQTGSYSMSVGALSAVGGAFVPVNDAAVTLNTGYLVYDQCVLRGIVDRMRENGTATLVNSIVNTYNTGRNGQPQFSQNIPIEQTTVMSQSVGQSLQNGTLSTVNPAFQAAVKGAIAQGYYAALNTPNAEFTCSYSGDMSSVLNGNPSGSVWDALTAEMNPACNPYWAYTLANTQVMATAQSKVNDMMTQLQWYNGNYPVMGTDANGNPIVLTPGSVVGANAIQALQSGYTQLQNANDIDQMVGALFAGITSQVMSSSQGLVGLTQPTGGQASYLSQVVAQSAQGLRNSAINAGLGILTSQQQIETQILNLAQGILNKIAGISQSLQAQENACWTTVIKNVCATALSSTDTCTATAGSCTTDPTTGQTTCPTGNTLKVATSTYQFAQGAINSLLTPYQQVHQQIASSSQTSLSQIGSLITQLTNTSSYTAQLTALQGLDALVAAGTVLHKPQDVQNEQSASNTLVGQNGGTGQLDQNLTDTATAWTSGTPTGQAFSGTGNSTGWCNVNSPTTIAVWQAMWKQ